MTRQTFQILCSLAVLKAEITRPRSGILSSQWEPVLPLTGWVYLWTFTLPDSEATLTALQQRWRSWSANWKRDLPYWRGVRVFEVSIAGRWHVHVVGVERFCVMSIRGHAQRYGFGRVNVKRIPAMKAGYVAKYLVKMRDRAECEGVRLAACFGFHGVKVGDIEITDTWSKYVLEHTPQAEGQFTPWHMRESVALKRWLDSTRNQSRVGPRNK